LPVTRPYQARERQRQVDAGREKILAAARELLDGDDGEAFSIDAVARRAGVARMTVYNQFESKAGLLEDLFDSIAERGAFGRMGDVFAIEDPDAAMDAFVELFGRFWTSSRRAHRKLRAAALLDEDLEKAIVARNERRRFGIAELVRRIGKERKLAMSRDEAVNVMFVLMSFDTFDALAGPDRSPAEVVPIVRRLVRLVTGA
jgi:AcrR family transcriptional regulator